MNKFRQGETQQLTVSNFIADKMHDQIMTQVYQLAIDYDLASEEVRRLEKECDWANLDVRYCAEYLIAKETETIARQLLNTVADRYYRHICNWREGGARKVIEDARAFGEKLIK